MTQAVLSIRLPPELKSEFTRLCRSNDQSPSAVLRAAARQLARQPQAVPAIDVVRDQPDPSRERIEIRLTGSERQAIERISSEAGASTNKWISNLVRAYITRDPQLGMHELQAVGESNRQLSAIGRNLNQIALALNRGGESDDVAESIFKLTDQINEHREKVYVVIRSNIDRWRVTWPES